MTIHKFLDDFRRLITWGGPILLALATLGWSQRRKGKADAIAEQQEQRLENIKKARIIEDETSNLSEDELNDIARRNGWMLDDEDEDGRL
jgi:hypothetical protein